MPRPRHTLTILLFIACTLGGGIYYLLFQQEYPANTKIAEFQGDRLTATLSIPEGRALYLLLSLPADITLPPDTIFTVEHRTAGGEILHYTTMANRLEERDWLHDEAARAYILARNLPGGEKSPLPPGVPYELTVTATSPLPAHSALWLSYVHTIFRK